MCQHRRPTRTHCQGHLGKFHSTIPPELSTSVSAQEVPHPNQDGMAVVKKTTLVGPT